MRSSTTKGYIGALATITAVSIGVASPVAAAREPASASPTVQDPVATPSAPNESTAGAAPSEATPSEATDQSHQREQIQVTTAMLSPRRNNSLSPRRFVPVRGDGTPLRGARFYLEIGRPDLAATYRRRQAIRWSLFGGGAALLVAGMGVAIAGKLREPDNRTMTLVGLSVASGGVLTLASSNVFAYFAPAHPIEPAVAKDLIDEHNAQLRARASQGRTARIRVGPQLSGTSAGLTISGSF